jgi:hypothetical protein
VSTSSQSPLTDSLTQQTLFVPFCRKHINAKQDKASKMGGSVSSLVSDLSDEKIIQELDVMGYKPNTKETLLKNIHFADSKSDEAKKNYGNGISVKGIIANISAKHFLLRTNQKKQMGKDWNDSAVNLPSNSMGPLDASHFFDAKRDGSMMGTCGGVTYQIVDKDSFIQGYVAIAWQNPYNSGHFVHCVLVSKTDDLLDECLNHCYNNNSSKIGGFVTEELEGKIKNFITAHAFDENKSTAYLVVGIKTDAMVREVLDEL